MESDYPDNRHETKAADIHRLFIPYVHIGHRIQGGTLHILLHRGLDAKRVKQGGKGYGSI